MPCLPDSVTLHLHVLHECGLGMPLDVMRHKDIWQQQLQQHGAMHACALHHACQCPRSVLKALASYTT